MVRLYKQQSESTFQFFSIRIWHFWYHFLFLQKQSFARVLQNFCFEKVIGKSHRNQLWWNVHCNFTKKNFIAGYSLWILRNFSEQIFCRTPWANMLVRFRLLWYYTKILELVAVYVRLIKLWQFLLLSPTK